MSNLVNNLMDVVLQDIVNRCVGILLSVARSSPWMNNSGRDKIVLRHFCFSSRLYRKLLALFLAATMAACSIPRPPKAYPGSELPEAQVAELSRKTFSRRVSHYSFGHLDGYQTVDGLLIRNAGVLEILPGRHKVGIEVEWSNRFRDNTQLEFTAVAGKKYTAALYELKEGEDPATADLSEPFSLGPTDPKTVLMLVIITLPLWLPFAIYEWTKEPEPPPTARPFIGCCFVWIQDDESGVVVAGVSPKSVKSEGDRHQPPND